ncbi:MAG TPA: hypothetical protein VJN95_16590 [Gemmatimonadales bacterium]|nr:hypothetical protein [Gemmatimonadales bacterium]
MPRPAVALLPLELDAPNTSQYAGLSITGIRITATIPDPAADKLDTLNSKTFPFAANQSSLTANLPVTLDQAEENVDVTVEYLSGTLVVFSGTQQVLVKAGPPGTTGSVSIPVTYVGPGSSIAALNVQPKDTVLTAGGTLQMRVSAVDSQAANVPAFYVSWGTTSAAGTIDANGMLHAGGADASFYVRAATPTAVRDSARITIIPSSVILAKISGDSQSAALSTRLPLPIVVQLTDDLGLPIPGVPIAFAAGSGGGSVDTAIVHTDANGAAGTTVTLGPTAGIQSFTATIAGAAAVTFSATATPIGPTTPTWTGTTSTDWSNPGNWSTGLVPSASDSVVIPATVNNPILTSSALVGAVDVQGGTLELGGMRLNVTRSFRTTGSGTLSMTNVSSLLVIGGDAVFAGGATSTTLSAGTIQVGGNFTQAGGALTFAPTAIGTLLTRFSGSALQTVSFNTSDPSPTQPDLRNVQVNGTGGITTPTGMWIHGALDVSTPVSVGGVLIEVDSTLTTVAGSTYNPTQTLLGGSAFNVAGTYNVNLTSFVGGPSQVVPSTLPLVNVAIPTAITTSSVLNITGFLRLVSVQASASFVWNTPRLTLGADLNVNGDLEVREGQLILNGRVLTADGNFSTSGPGVLRMDTPGDQLNVALNATFDGGDETDVLTTGILRVAGNFTQASTNSPHSFLAGSPHQTIFSGSTPQVIAFADTLQSGFGDLTINGTGGVTVSSLPLVNGALNVLAGTVTASDLSNTGTGLFVKGNVTTSAGTTLNLGRLYTEDTLRISGTYNVRLTGFAGNNNQPIPVGLSYQDLDLAGAGAFTQGAINVSGQMRMTSGRNFVNSGLFLAGRLTIAGDLIIDQPNTELVNNGETVSVGGNLTIQNGGLITMGNANDSLLVAGAALFDGGDESTHLTGGHMVFAGAFTQKATSSAQSFLATGTQASIFTGTGQNISFATPGAGNSQFVDLSFTQATGPVNFTSDVTAAGVVQWGGLKTFSGGGHTLTLSTFNVGNGAVFDNLLIKVLGSGPMSTTAVTFQNYAPTADVLTVTGPGVVGANNTIQAQWASPITTGHYVVANDTDGAIPTPLTLTIFSSGIPGVNGGPLGALQINGAIVTWQN